MTPSSATPTALVYDEFYKRHLSSVPHPECPARCDAVMEALNDAGVLNELLRVAPRKATHEEILTCHVPYYYELAKADIETGETVLSTGDTNVTRDSFEAALQRSLISRG